MNVLRTLTVALLLLASAALSAQEEIKGTIENTVGVMTEPVIRARMAKMGYTNVQIVKTHALQFQIRALKEGKPAVLVFHPQTGAILEHVPGKVAPNASKMPTEPLSEHEVVQPRIPERPSNSG
jgi:uncharacterized protein (DUF2141 family)